MQGTNTGQETVERIIASNPDLSMNGSVYRGISQEGHDRKRIRAYRRWRSGYN